VGIPLMVGFRLSRKLWLSQSPFTNSSSFMTEFWLSRSFSHELSFCQWNLGYHEAFLMIFFTRWNLGYHGAFPRIFHAHGGISAIMEPFSRIFLSHGGISAITEPFHEFFLHMVESRLSWSLFTNFSFTWWNLDYNRAFSRIFVSHGGIHKMHNLGKTLFIYITKSIYIGSASLKTLPLDLNHPL
jgi:hypothetical protein